MDNLKKNHKDVTGLEKRMEDVREALPEKIKDLKRNQSKMKSTVIELGNRIDAMNTTMEEAKEELNNIEDKIMENEAEQKIKKELWITRVDKKINESIKCN